MPGRRKNIPPKVRKLPEGIEFRRDRFRVRYAANTQRHCETFPSLELAKQALQARHTDVARGKLALLDEKSVPVFAEWAGKYLELHIKRNGRTNLDFWERKERYRFDRLVHEFGNLPLRAIRPIVVDAYRKRELDSGRTHEAVRREFVLLKTIINHAVRSGVIAENPMASVKTHRPVGERRPEVLTEEEEKAIFDQLTGERAKYRPLFILALNTGLRRRNELLTLNWRDVNLAVFSSI